MKEIRKLARAIVIDDLTKESGWGAALAGGLGIGLPLLAAAYFLSKKGVDINIPGELSESIENISTGGLVPENGVSVNLPDGLLESIQNISTNGISVNHNIEFINRIFDKASKTAQAARNVGNITAGAGGRNLHGQDIPTNGIYGWPIVGPAAYGWNNLARTILGR